MAQAEKLSLSWDSHQKSICSGLSLLQQRGEFVDMTLAADGHHVKVHQLVLSLVSPYIKALISSAQCPHPVIFLNNISYSTLCAILEYIYTGEVNVDRSNLAEFIAAGKALHIRGLREMDEEQTLDPSDTSFNKESTPEKSYFCEKLGEHRVKKRQPQQRAAPMCKIYVGDDDIHDDSMMDTHNDSTDDFNNDSNADVEVSHTNKLFNEDLAVMPHEESKKALMNRKVQFTVSNQGGLQVIYNRYLYNMRYCCKNRNRLWRCVEYNRSRCFASMTTDLHNRVIARSNTHTHPFHDDKILKKLRAGAIYSLLREAETKADNKKKERNVQHSP